ncbi:MAG: ParA family protein [Bacteroidetes bacterium]|nr:MAG: ParA family protein [Bacteroidota bacterium]
MITLALYNIKGGVGKTAGCVNLAYLAAQEGKQVLIWDLDPQGAATFYFEETAKIKGGIKKLLLGEAPLADAIKPTAFDNLSLLPADFGNRHIDGLLDDLKQSKKRFKSLVAQLQGHYDYLFIDCAPGVGTVSEAIFAAADVVLFPTIPTTLSIRTWEMANTFFTDNQLSTNKLYAYFSMADIRKTMHNDTMAQFYRNKQFLKNYIPYLSTIEKMGSHLAPVAHFAPSSYAAQCFRDLWKELKKQLG